MPRNEKHHADPKDWLRRARSNLARARQRRRSPEILYEDLCFDAQQAVEKVLKALLVQRGILFPRTHDILVLLTLLQRNGIEISEGIRQSDTLTQYAVVTRYPGPAEEVGEDDYTTALAIAERVVRWAQRQITVGAGESGRPVRKSLKKKPSKRNE